MEINFANPQYLWFLLSIFVLIFSHSIIFKNTQKKALKFANFEAIARVTGNSFIKKNTFLLVFRITILTLVVLSVSGTSITYIGKTTESNYVLALDTSASMLVEDIKPNRFDASKETLKSFLDLLPRTTKVGLLTFSGINIIESPLESDLNKINNIIDNLKISEIAGTDIGNAIVTSSNVLISEKDEKSKVIVLITDGQSNIGVPVEEAVNYANKNNIIVNTIGIGTEEGGSFIGVDVKSKIDEGQLKQIAERTSGLYFGAETSEKLIDSLKQITELNRRKISFDLSFSFLFLALILLFIEWGLINTKFKIIS